MTTKKNFYPTFCAAQVSLVVIMYVFLYWGHALLRMHGTFAPVSYLHAFTVMVLMVVIEAATRPEGRRVDAGAGSSKQARSMALRQALWMIAGYVVYFGLTKDIAISRIFLTAFVLSSAMLFYLSNRWGRVVLFKLCGLNDRKLKLKTLVMGSSAWCGPVTAHLHKCRDLVDLMPLMEITADTKPEQIIAYVTGADPDLLVLPSRELPLSLIRELMILGDRRGFSAVCGLVDQS